MAVSQPRSATLAVGGLVALGLFLIAISVPPLFNAVFGEEPTIWSPGGVVNGLVYLAAAGLLRARSRLGVGLAIVLGMVGFTLAFGLTLARLQMALMVLRGEASVHPILMVELIVFALLAAAHAVVVGGALDGARRWNLVGELDARWCAAAALLAGVGFALGLGFGGGEYAITLAPITMPQVYEMVEHTIAIPHFVAFAAIAVNGRFATIGSLALIVASIFIGVQVLAALGGWRNGLEGVLESVLLWTLLLLAWVVAGLLLLWSAWMDVHEATARRLAPDRA